MHSCIHVCVCVCVCVCTLYTKGLYSFLFLSLDVLIFYLTPPAFFFLKYSRQHMQEVSRMSSNNTDTSHWRGLFPWVWNKEIVHLDAELKQFIAVLGIIYQGVMKWKLCLAFNINLLWYAILKYSNSAQALCILLLFFLTFILLHLVLSHVHIQTLNSFNHLQIKHSRI